MQNEVKYIWSTLQCHMNKWCSAKTLKGKFSFLFDKYEKHKHYDYVG